ncbi:MAG: sugar transferase [Lachnospiraceae bacterium]|nr:sugar transferase [Lachnospiraceae bacterium]
MLKKWEELPEYMKNDQVKKYYKILKKKQGSMALKRAFDFLVSLLMLIILSPVFLVIAILIKTDSKGPVMFRQVRVTQYGREFRIFKFRTMVNDAESKGSQVTTKNDMRITKVGKKIRGCRLDELPQLINVLLGDMTFVGTRPEVPKYVKEYSPEMYATLLLPAGITSECSIQYKDEDKLLADADNADKVYVEKVLPGKMEYNLKDIENFSFLHDIKTMFKTVLAVLK